MVHALGFRFVFRFAFKKSLPLTIEPLWLFDSMSKKPSFPQIGLSPSSGTFRVNQLCICKAHSLFSCLLYDLIVKPDKIFPDTFTIYQLQTGHVFRGR